MKKLSLVIAMLVFGSLLPMSVQAQVFDLTTGTNGAGGTGAAGTNDPIWTLRLPGGTTFNPVRISTGVLQSGTQTFPNAYVQNDCGEWISPWLNAANNIIPTPGTVGTFTYRMQFTINNCVRNPSARLSLNFMAADNRLTAVSVNGVAQTVPSGITHLNSGSMTSTPAVMNGVNTIEVSVRNDGSYTALQLCGNIEVSGGLVAPQNLNCCNAQGRNLLSWNPVAGATGYQIEIAYNDPACCIRPSGWILGETVNITDNVFLFTPATCYAWRVLAVNGSCFSEWSERKCGCFTLQIAQANNDRASKPNVNNAGKLQVNEVMTKIDPNPASGVVTIGIANPTETLKTDVCELVIINVAGVQVLRESIQLNIPKEVKVDRLKSGMYICKIVADGRVVATEKLVIK